MENSGRGQVEREIEARVAGGVSRRWCPTRSSSFWTVLRLRRYSLRTEQSYCDWIRRYVKFQQITWREELSPGTAKVEEFLRCRASLVDQNPKQIQKSKARTKKWQTNGGKRMKKEYSHDSLAPIRLPETNQTLEIKTCMRAVRTPMAFMFTPGTSAYTAQYTESPSANHSPPACSIATLAPDYTGLPRLEPSLPYAICHTRPPYLQPRRTRPP
jgi:hypothetical protein